jgi:hypothetical protein
MTLVICAIVPGYAVVSTLSVAPCQVKIAVKTIPASLLGRWGVQSMVQWGRYRPTHRLAQYDSGR